MIAKEKAMAAFEDWYNNLPVHKASGGPAKGTIAAALVVLERLKKDFSLNLEDHRAPGGSQIKGASGAAVAKILARFKEERPFAKEGGRTNRGGPGDIRGMLAALENAGLEDIDSDERVEIIDELQCYLAGKVTEVLNRDGLKMVYNETHCTWQNICNLLRLAREAGKEGPVAQHLVGAKLQLRFPNIEIGNESYSTADDQLGRHGDFLIGDTVFHVTVAPMPAVYEKCNQNLNNGLRPYLLVPDRCLAAARQNVELMIPGRVTVEAIESFIGQNIDELSIFSKDGLIEGINRLIDTYNQRVNASEIDKSMLIEIPLNLSKSRA